MNNKRPDFLIRTTLTHAEWERFKRIAKKRDIPASRLAAHKLREVIAEEQRG
jgi:hypothetical protein